MNQIEIVRLLRDQPFRPFRMQLTDGISYEIRHPHMAIVTPAAVYVGIPAPNSQNPIATDIVIVSIRHIIQLEYLSPPGAATVTSSSNNP